MTASDESGDCRFATTRWTVVLAAGREESTESRDALTLLYQTYWFPLYVYLRRWGCDVHQAEDCTQAFFEHLLEKHGLRKAKPGHSRFRTFLIASLKNFLTDQWRHASAKKRGGPGVLLSLDVVQAERQYSSDMAHRLSPDRLFERSWALTVLQNALAKLRSEYVDAGKGPVFEHLKRHITAEQGEAKYRNSAQELEMTEEALRVAAYRLRRRLREFVRAEIKETVSDPTELDQEIRDLFAALGD